MPAEPQAAVKKNTSSRNWIMMDCSGEKTVLDVDKYAIMHRVQIHARDLRILDPLLSYPSTILGRERAIVLNLEVHLFYFLFFKYSGICFDCFLFGILGFDIIFLFAFFFLIVACFSISRLSSLLKRSVVQIYFLLL